MTPFDVLVEEMKQEALKEFGSKFGVTGGAIVGDKILHDLHKLFVAEIVTHTAYAVQEATVREITDYLRAAFKDQSEIGVNHLNLGLDYLATLSTKEYD